MPLDAPLVPPLLSRAIWALAEGRGGVEGRPGVDIGARGEMGAGAGVGFTAMSAVATRVGNKLNTGGSTCAGEADDVGGDMGL